MNEVQILLVVLLLALATALTRFLPFAVFRDTKKMPVVLDYLGKVLPAAMMGLLVVYCFKDVNFSEIKEVVPALAAAGCVVAVHLWRRNTILSIALGTAVYMILIRVL